MHPTALALQFSIMIEILTVRRFSSFAAFFVIRKLQRKGYAFFCGTLDSW